MLGSRREMDFAGGPAPAPQRATAVEHEDPAAAAALPREQAEVMQDKFLQRT
jgi:hypothetical protein